METNNKMMKKLMMILSLAILIWSCEDETGELVITDGGDTTVVSGIDTVFVGYNLEEEKLLYRLAKYNYESADETIYSTFRLGLDGCWQYVRPDYMLAGCSLISEESSPGLDSVRIGYDPETPAVLFEWNIAAQSGINDFLRLEASLDSSYWETIWQEDIQEGCLEGCTFGVRDDLRWLEWVGGD